MTGKDIESFLNKSASFFSNQYLELYRYYSGEQKEIGSLPFTLLSDLEKECSIYFEVFTNSKKQLNSTKWYDLLEQLENIDNGLKMSRKINKWTRSSVTKVAYSPNAQYEYTLPQKKTLERVAEQELLSRNPEDDWVDIALDNNLSEEDYSSEGGNILNLELNRIINYGVKVRSVVDLMYGKSIYGKDLDKRIQFEDEDLKVLNYDDTIKQAVEILIMLKKRDNPDYINHGLQTIVAVGSTRSALNFPIINRQLTETFANDDTLKQFKVLNVYIEQDNLFVEFSVKTRLDEVESYKISLV